MILEYNIEELKKLRPKDRHFFVKVICDRCGKQYRVLCDTLLKHDTEQQYCSRCQARETNLLKYGVENVFQCKEIQEKQKQTCIEKYGCENVFQNEAIKAKSKQSLIEHYGADHPMHNQEIKQQVLRHRNETMCRNGTCICSAAQRHIYDLIGGELNKYIDGVWLDILLPCKDIYLEYNGSGHDIQVKYGKIARKDFLEQEIKCYQMLKARGLKEIEIKSNTDILPKDSIIISVIDFALLYLHNTPYHHIIFNLDSQCIKTTNKDIAYNYLTPIICNQNNNHIVTTIGEDTYIIGEDIV